ncbi:flippase-like domain-containing protein [candidate division WOR-3 bacterium]|nr:flippase-like domain-containing protein [candidate division WOR-3 bacterium]
MNLAKKFLGPTVVLIVFVFIGRSLYINWTQIPFQELSFNFGFLAISLVLQISYFTVISLGWKLVLKNLNEKISLKNAIQIHAITQFGRYVPGKFLAPLGKVYFAKRLGISGYKTFVSIVLETILSILSALIIFSISLIWFIDKGLPRQIYLMLFVIPLCLIALHPGVLPRIVNWGLKILKKESIKFTLHYSRILQLLLIYFLNWIIYGFCFYFLIKSFYPIAYSVLLPLLGSNAIAWIIGFLSFIVPGGLGIREGILSFLLKYLIPTSIGIISALIWRVWVIIGMFIFIAIFAKGFKSIIRKNDTKISD